MSNTNAETFLLVDAGALRCALPLSLVREVMRPLPLRLIDGLGPAVLGAAIVRGIPLPVLSLPLLLGQTPSAAGRFVVFSAGEKDCVLAVDAVRQIASIHGEQWRQKPRLLDRVEFADRLAVEDHDLIASLDTARLLAEIPTVEAWSG